MMTISTNRRRGGMLSIMDPRDKRRILHPIENILTIAVCSVMAGGEGWEDMETFGLAKRDVLGQFLDMSAGVPQHDVYRRVFNRIDPEHFRDVFLEWTRGILAQRLLGQIAIDGKTMRGSGDAWKDQPPLHMVSAWACDHSMVLSQVTTDVKSNEITAIPELLRAINLEGTLVTSDAMGCQYAIAQQILDGKGHYLFALKGNQGTLHADMKEYFEGARDLGFQGFSYDRAQTHEKNRGRDETRTAYVFSDVQWLQDRHENWTHINSIIAIERIRCPKGETDPHRETWYYMSDKKMSADEALTAVRKHWQVENALHWVLDVTFREDECQIHDPVGAENLAITRHVALNVLKRDTTRKASIRKKKKLAGWDDSALIDFLKQL